MKHLFSLTAALALLFVWTAPAGAQGPAIRVNVPFTFTAGSQVLPAGEYQFLIDTEHMLSRIVPVSGGATLLVRLVPGPSYRSADKTDTGILRFQKYGAHYVLAGVWRAGSIEGHGFTGVKAPRELETAAVRDVTETR